MATVEPVPMRSQVVGFGGVLHRDLVNFLQTLRTLLSRVIVRVGASNLTAQAATIAATDIAAPALLQNVLHRVTYSLRITQAATVSSSATLTLGWTTNSVSCTQSFAAVTGNTTATQQSGSIVIFPDAASSVNYSVAYASVGATSMTFALDVLLDVLPYRNEDSLCRTCSLDRHEQLCFRPILK